MHRIVLWSRVYVYLFMEGIWLHIEGDTTPQFTADGHVDKTDGSNTLISDLRSYLQAAQRHGILVFICLWNGAKKQSPHYR